MAVAGHPDDAPTHQADRCTVSSTSIGTDGVRARELYKYFRPPTPSTAPEAPDTVLTAHVQLLAWRLNAQRAMVSLIDHETQYFVAESTKTLNLDNALEHENPDDANWVLQGVQCVDVPKAGRLCEYTIATLPPPDGGPACFEVLDLSKDDRFNTLEFVRGPPYFRYYVGVPLRTKKGVNIGSIFAMDNHAREPISESAKHFLGVMGDNVVQHLEMLKEKKDNQRSTTMNRCLSAFVDPEHQTRTRRRRSSAHGSPARSKKAYSSQPSSSPYDSDSSHGRRVEMDENLNTFTRAAELLREALDVEEGGGGVVFLDTMAARTKHRPSFTHVSSAGEVSSSQESGKEEPGWRVSVHSTQPKSSRLHASHSRPAAILAQSHSPQKGRPDFTRQQFLPMSTAELSTLIKRHPRGKRFTFTHNGVLVASSSDEQSAAADSFEVPKSKRTTASKTEIDLLKRSFPTARQIVFLPLWDSTTSRWSACFAYNCCDFRNFSHNPEFLYCIAFSNCVITEISRLATVIADQQKSDFIGSISHEFRSPLHGILASCEFLGDTDCTTFQRSLIDTADGCARTLLDTINMVLDYSKINMLEKNVSKAKRSKRDTLWGGDTSINAGLQTHLNIYGDVDIAAITEEVVEGVATGHFFKDSVTNLDVHELMDAAPKGGKLSNMTNGVSVQRPKVNIILDIPQREWTFWSQAGALRRIVMNLFGNSLKYTKLGFIKVKLDAEDVQPSTQSTICTYVTLTVTDSGQGMSPEYMRTKLFTPFAQESSITPGTGLGLSLVKSIVNMLNGEIEVTSTLDVGSKVVVRLPMAKTTLHASSSGSTSSPSTAGSSAERVKDSSVKVVQTEASRRTIATYWKERVSDTDTQRDSSVMMRETVYVYLNEWYGFKACKWDKSLTWDMIVTEEADIHELIAEAPYLSEPNCKTMVLILRNTTASQMAKSSFPNCDNFEEIRHPFGPYKLARALRVCLERLQSGLAKPRLGSIPALARVDEDGLKLPVEDITARVENITLSSPGAKFPDVSIIRNGTTSAREDSINAQMAMTPPETSAPSYGTVEYPFPHPSNRKDLRVDGTVSPTAERELHATSRPPMVSVRRAISTSDQETRLKDLTKTDAMSSLGALTNVPRSNPTPTKCPPRMLLVDDNRINLKLLQTFMKKRKSPNVTSAEDGLQAVNAYQSLLSKSLPPDIVLMDISMPVMNGFEATRRIREIEREHCAELPPMETPPSCLIIALTGLASARDQSEAFMSGFDMYITKPVSFAEISRLLDNWEANGGGNAKVPHGAVASDERVTKREMDMLVENERTKESHSKDKTEKDHDMGFYNREEIKDLISGKEEKSLDPEKRIEKEVVIENANTVQDVENRKTLEVKATKLDETGPDIHLKLPDGLREQTEMDTQAMTDESLKPEKEKEKEKENMVQIPSPSELSKPDTATYPSSAPETLLGVPGLSAAKTSIVDHNHERMNPCAEPFTLQDPPQAGI